MGISPNYPLIYKLELLIEEREKTKKKNKPAKKKMRRRRRSESKVIRVFLIFYQKTGQNFNYTKSWTKKSKCVMM